MFSRSLIFATFVMALWMAVPADATTYYVATTGSDSGSCAQSSPCLTISHAYSLAGPGDVVTVSAGTYSESLSLNRNGNSGSPIIVEGYAAGGACPTTQQTDAISPVKTRPNPSVTIKSVNMAAGYNTLDCFRITSGSAGVTISANNVNVLDNYIDGTSMSDASVGVSMSLGSCCTLSNAYVAHNFITNTEYGMWLEGSSSTFEYNEVYQLQYGGTSGDCDYNRIWGDGLIFNYNYYHGMNLSTMCVKAAPHVDCWQTYYVSGNTYSRNHKFNGNTCQNFHEGFMASDTGAGSGDMSNWTVTNNVFDVGPMGPWCGVFDGQGFTVTYNNNTCYGGLVVSRDSWGSGGAHVTATNNIFYLPGWYAQDNCNYHSETGGSVGGSTNNIDYDPGYSLSCNSGDHQNVNPDLVSPGSDYHLQSSSPAVGAGTNVGLTADHDGNPRPTPGGGYDIGAYQLAGGSAVVNAPTNLTATVH